MRLRHCHIPGIISYGHGEKLQQHLARQLLAHKAASSTPSSRTGSSSAPPPAPDPTILTCQFHPVYTVGRRETGAVSTQQQAFLRASGTASFHESPRGGLTTFHGPGQLVAYPVLDLRRHGLSARSYICALEAALIATCAAWGIAARRTAHVGVWVSEERKIASVGVHLRRGVASHGVALNVCTDLAWFERIVACGLEDKVMTSFEAEGVPGVDVGDVGRVFVEDMAGRLDGVEEIVGVSEEEVMTGTVEQ